MLKFYVDNSAPVARPYIACGIVLITPIMALEEEVLKTLNRGIWMGCRRLEAAAPKGHAVVMRGRTHHWRVRTLRAVSSSSRRSWHWGRVLKTLNRGVWWGCRRLEAAAPKG